MTSIARIKASDGSGNAAVATIQNSRTAGSSTIHVDTVAGIPATFYGSMGTPHTFVDPITAETITLISEATAVDFSGHVNGANLEIDAISPGYTDLGSAVNDIVIIRPTTDYANNVAAAMTVVHNDDGSLKNAIVAVTNLAAQLQLGWSTAGETWAYVSGTGTITGVFKIVGVDLTAKYQAGDRVKFTQTQVKYGIITKVAVVGSDTQVTLLMSATSGTVDNSGLTNTAISANYYSHNKSAFGFPTDPARWTITVSSTGACVKASPANGTWYGDTGLSATGPSIVLPIGVWIPYYAGEFEANRTATATVAEIYASLSTSSSSESDPTLTTRGFANVTSATATDFIFELSKGKPSGINVASSTPYYLVIMSNNSMTNIKIRGDDRATLIYAVCGYL